MNVNKYAEMLGAITEKQNEDTSKHNKRVKSIREKRLPKDCVVAIDQSIRAMDDLHDALCEWVCNGEPELRVDDVVQLGKALQNLKREFNYRELVS